MRKSIAVGLLGLLATTAIPALAAEPQFSADRIKADISFLADDLTEGRAPGTRGYDVAALYVAQQFAGLGLSPGNGASWYQQVPFVVSKLDPARPSSLTIGARDFANLEHVIVSPTNAAAAIDESAPVVFVGYGLEDKKLGLDDYRGLDVRGKIVAYLWGTPEGLPSEVAATLNNKKNEMAASKGAIGVLSIVTPTLEKIFPWPQIVENSLLPKMRWVHPDGRVEDPTGALRLSAMLDPVAAKALFEGSPLAGSKFDAMMADRKARPKGFTMPAKVRLARNSLIERITSPNVIGVIPGSDPALAGEVVLLSAHLDHLGLKSGATGDNVYNGAIDNASGVATMLEVARAFATSENKPKRSVAFVALTAEEKGLLGSEYLAKYPLPAGRKIVADVNLDAPMLTSDFSDVIAYGAEHSTIGTAIARAAASMNLKLTPDPTPEQNFFVRSDHYSFVKEGVPGISFATGFAGGGKAANEAYEADHYHRVADDLTQPFVWAAGAKFARLNYLVARELADAPTAPKWYAGDYFGDRFAPKAEKAPH
jgi:hypothetical protein